MQRRALLLWAAGAMPGIGLAQGGEVRVLAAGAAKHALETLAPAFERKAGTRLQATFDTVGAQRDRVLRGEPADVVLLSDAALAQLRQAGRLAGLAPVVSGEVQVGIAVPATTAPPLLATEDQLRAALRSAASIAYADPARGATAGTHFAQVLAALGLQDELRGRLTVLPFGVDVVQAVAQGRFALGISQSSEIVQQAGVRYAGPLPAPHARATGYAAAAVQDTPGARALLAFLASEEAVRAFRGSGFAAPGR